MPPQQPEPGATVLALPVTDAFKRVDRGRSHSYTLNGQKVPSVTHLMGDGVPKPALVRWGPRVVAEHVADHLDEELESWQGMGRDSLVGYLAGVPWGERDRAANRGHEVHELARRIASGDEVEVPDELVGHVDSYLAFLRDWRPTDEEVERPCLNRRWRYAGTFDLLCTLPPPYGRSLIDLKTSRSGIFPETALQLAAYRFCEVYERPDGRLAPMPTVESCLAVWLRADGYDVHQVTADAAAFQTFLYAADLAQRFIQAPRESFVGPALTAPEAP